MLNDRRAACVLLLLLLAGCAGATSASRPAGAGSGPPLSITPGESRSVCQAAGSEAPPFESIFDAEAALRAAASVRAEGAVLFSAWTDSLGLPVGLHRLEHSLPDAAADELENALIPTLQGNPAHRRAAVRVRFDLVPGAPPRVRTAPSYECTPELVNRAEVAELLTQAAAGAQGRGTAQVWVFIGRDGAVRNARINQSAGSAIVDAIAVGIATRMRFTPATIDDQYVPVWIQIPVSVR